jgi:hypothetical protein
MSNALKTKLPQNSSSPLWDQIKKLKSNCGLTIEEEQMCDLMRGPDHESCQKLFLQNEDCYQRVLCFERFSFASIFSLIFIGGKKH